MVVTCHRMFQMSKIPISFWNCLRMFSPFNLAHIYMYMYLC